MFERNMITLFHTRHTITASLFQFRLSYFNRNITIKKVASTAKMFLIEMANKAKISNDFEGKKIYN